MKKHKSSEPLEEFRINSKANREETRWGKRAWNETQTAASNKIENCECNQSIWMKDSSSTYFWEESWNLADLRSKSVAYSMRISFLIMILYKNAFHVCTLN